MKADAHDHGAQDEAAQAVGKAGGHHAQAHQQHAEAHDAHLGEPDGDETQNEPHQPGHFAQRLDQADLRSGHADLFDGKVVEQGAPDVEAKEHKEVGDNEGAE